MGEMTGRDLSDLLSPGLGVVLCGQLTHKTAGHTSGSGIRGLDSIPSLASPLSGAQLPHLYSGTTAQVLSNPNDLWRGRQDCPRHVCTSVFTCVCARTAVPLPRLPGGREEGIFGALGSTVVGLITGFQLQAGGHALGRGVRCSETLSFSCV